ncbi:MAG: c-type cytochrome [Gallionella sp.]
MTPIKGYMIQGLAFILALVVIDAFAEDVDDSTSFTLVPGGRVSAKVNEERKEVKKLLRHISDPIAGKEKSFLCQGCHGEFGDSSDPAIPKLAGQYSNYISKQVRNFKLGTRANQIMSAMAVTVDDDDLSDIADYFASQKKMSGVRKKDNPLGEKLFLKRDISIIGLACVNCHGERGYGLTPQISAFPVIGGQHKDYIRQQLTNFRDGIRTNTPNDIMNRMTEPLTDTEIDSLAEYVSLQPLKIPVEPIKVPVDQPKRTRKHAVNNSRGIK